MPEITPVHAAVLAVLVLLFLGLAAVNFMINDQSDSTGYLGAGAACGNGSTAGDGLPLCQPAAADQSAAEDIAGR